MDFRNLSLMPFLTDSLGSLSVKESLSFLSPLLPILNQPVAEQGSSERDILIGRLGDDSLRGGDGNDLLLGFAGDDLLFGEADDDRIWGGSGNDLIDGGESRNILWGGEGQDQFVLRPDGGIHIIMDYQVDVDRFRLQDGLTFSQLSITQADKDAQIRYLGESDVSVVLKNTQASELSMSDFVSANLVPAFDSLFIFGDSLSDPGNLFDLTGFFPPTPYSNGRFTNGEIWVDYFADSLALAPDRVSNFAVGGATTGDVNTIEPLVESLTGVDLTLPGLSGQVDAYLASLAGHSSDANGLHVVWVGANDLFNAPDNPADIPEFLTNSIDNVIDAISRLAATGAEAFLVPNLPNLGLTPRSLSSGNSAQAESLSIAFNTGLTSALDALESTLDIDIVEFDVLTRTNDIINSPESFGLTNVTDPLIRQVPPVDAGFFWWDDIHPTTVIHEIFSDAFQTELLEAGYLLSAGETASLRTSGVAADNQTAAIARTKDSDLFALAGQNAISLQNSLQNDWDGSLVETAFGL